MQFYHYEHLLNNNVCVQNEHLSNSHAIDVCEQFSNIALLLHISKCEMWWRMCNLTVILYCFPFFFLQCIIYNFLLDFCKCYMQWTNFPTLKLIFKRLNMRIVSSTKFALVSCLIVWAKYLNYENYCYSLYNFELILPPMVLWSCVVIWRKVWLESTINQLPN